MASVDNNSYDITYLTGQDTFLDWINHYNTNVVEKLNKLELYSGWSGDGVDVVLGTTGSMQCRLADVVTKGITFNGAVSINGALTVDWDLAHMGSAKHKVFPKGSTATIKGFTTGQPVWVGMSGGEAEYYRARADSTSFAEVIGIVSGLTYASEGPYSLSNSYLEIVTHGVVGTSFGATVTDDSDAGLSAGCIYFLSPGTSGGLTTVEPTVAGHVSKPVLLGITADKGLVLNYRGQYLQGSGTGGTGGIDNNQFVVAVHSTSPIVRGDVVGFKVGQLNGGVDDNGWFTITDYENIDRTAGICINSKFAAAGGHYIRVLASGWTNDLPVAGGDGATDQQGLLYIGPTGLLTSTDPGGGSKLFAIGWESGGKIAGIVAPSLTSSSGAGEGRSFVADGVTYGFAVNENLLINGGFDVWQRSIGVGSKYSSTGSTYFADRWVRKDGIGITASAGTHSIERNTFDLNQTAVFGNPKYYASLRNSLTGGETMEYIHIENRLEDVRTLRNEEATLSFWSKCGLTGATMDIAITQYDGTDTTITYPQSVQLATSWNKYAVTFTVPNITTTPRGKHYLGVGFRTDRISGVCDLAKVKLERGNVATTNADINETEELNKCKRYYQRTYSIDEPTHSVTFSDFNTPSISVVDFTITPDKDLYHSFLVPMRDTPSITFFSPTGYTGDALNRTATRDLRNTSGSVGWNGVVRVAPAGGTNVSADYVHKEGMYITVPNGAVIFDNISMHYVADADLDGNM